MNIENIYKIYSKNYLVATDTRKIKTNSIFFALSGENFDGNKFAEEALAKGAHYAIIDNENYKTSDKMILVKDVLTTLQELARHHRNQLGIPIIGLTGSNGKTTTKELINIVLSEKFNTTATIGNLNNHIGVPLTLLSMTPDTELGIVEMGANHQGEIALLSSIAEPDYGYITNFGKAHLEGFGGIEGVIKGKSELYNYLRENSKKVFINSDDSLQIEKSKGITSIIGTSKGVSFDSASPYVNLRYKDKKIESQLIGSYNYQNIAIAITIGEYFKIDTKNIIRAIENYIPSNNRSQIIKKDNKTIILDAYNANPSSMLVALENIEQMKSESKVIILGDMFELGTDSKLEHQNIINRLEKINSKNSIVIGNHFFECSSKKVDQYKNIESFKNENTIDFNEKSTVLIKGSRGMALEKILDFI